MTVTMNEAKEESILHAAAGPTLLAGVCVIGAVVAAVGGYCAYLAGMATAAYCVSIGMPAILVWLIALSVAFAIIQLLGLIAMGVGSLLS